MAMVQFTLSLKIPLKKSDALVIPFWEEDKKPVLATKGFNDQKLQKILKFKDFSGSEGELLIHYPENSDQRILFLGLGKSRKIGIEPLRKAYGSLIKSLQKKTRCHELDILLPHITSLKPEQILEGVVEGILFSEYQFKEWLRSGTKEDKESALETIHLIGISDKYKGNLSFLITLHEASRLTKDLINQNADSVTPSKLFEVAKVLEKKHSALKVRILNKKSLIKEGLGLIYAVARGSSEDAGLIIVEYRGNKKSKDFSAIVGKGITYDTGGLSLKPVASMLDMKSDMSGAAAVLGTMKALAALKVNANVLGVVATAENAIGPLSYKVGDVYKSFNGKTVEIIDTDAEGRLVLADAISYIQKHYPLKRIIDLATLTGSMVIALGEEASGLFSNNEALSQALLASAEKTHERLWPMPIYAEYREKLKSQIADIKNAGGRQGGACIAALFLKEFIVKELPWAHLDISGVAYLSSPRHYHNTPATGFGVRLLVDFFQNEKG